jgi:hypothetical protein
VYIDFEPWNKIFHPILFCKRQQGFDAQFWSTSFFSDVRFSPPFISLFLWDGMLFSGSKFITIPSSCFSTLLPHSFRSFELSYLFFCTHMFDLFPFFHWCITSSHSHFLLCSFLIWFSFGYSSSYSYSTRLFWRGVSTHGCWYYVAFSCQDGSALIVFRNTSSISAFYILSIRSFPSDGGRILRSACSFTRNPQLLSCFSILYSHQFKVQPKRLRISLLFLEVVQVLLAIIDLPTCIDTICA